ncbi:hypothetical protein HBI18_207010 [Parastagonospora nodorum]|nr:hypothetical protein HBH46_197810 [Parastagonospora nodorum]KAH4919101.1 hypothetical protein HBI79_203840 [Parastagonospora nodorum]KAH5712620.1 hypothetical protein HBI18_207010 [Parastagonospora nodorum]
MSQTSLLVATHYGSVWEEHCGVRGEKGIVQKRKTQEHSLSLHHTLKATFLAALKYHSSKSSSFLYPTTSSYRKHVRRLGFRFGEQRLRASKHTRTVLLLSSGANEVLRRLKNRTPVTAEAIRNSWREVQTDKHHNPSVDKEGVTKEVGRLMQLSDKVGSIEVKKLGDVSEEYAEEVYVLWYILDKRRNSTRMASYQMWSDVGMLMELRDEEAKEILKSEEGWENVLPKDDIPLPQSPPDLLLDTNWKRPRPHDLHPNGMSNLLLEERSDKRQKRGDGYTSKPGDWRCGKCIHWNRKWWGACHNERCNGTMGEDAVEVDKQVDLA